MSNSGNWINPDFPKFGWRYEGWTYDVHQTFRCQACHNAKCKHIHFLWHDRKQISCGVGGTCAHNLLNPEDLKRSKLELQTAWRLWGKGKTISMRTPEERERYRKALDEEKAREAREMFAYQGRWWQTGEYVWVQVRANVVIRIDQEDDDCFVIAAGIKGCEYDWSSGSYPTLSDARYAAYDVFLEYLAKAKERGLQPGRTPQPVRVDPEDDLVFTVEASEGDALWRVFRRLPQLA